MAVYRRNIIDTVIANTFRYALLFGLTTHLYDRRRQRLVRSYWAHCYSLALHVTIVVLFPVLYRLSPRSGYYTRTEKHFFEKLFIFLQATTFLSVFVSIVLQWTSRAHAPALFNEIIQMWREDITHLRRSHAIRRQAGWLFVLKTTTTALVAANAAFVTYTNTGSTLSTAQSCFVFPLFNIIIVLGFQFSCGLIFSAYLFQVLNDNLRHVVKDVRSLCRTRRPPHAFRQRAVLLERELREIGRLHAQLQRWVVRLKDMYQVELLFSMSAFFVLQVYMLFVLCVVFYERWIGALLSYFLNAIATLFLGGLDATVIFHICSTVLSCCNAAGHVMKDLPGQKLRCNQLERCIEMMCLQLQHDKLRLRICGLFDLNWSKSFSMTEAGVMYVILLIQLDLSNFGK